VCAAAANDGCTLQAVCNGTAMTCPAQTIEPVNTVCYSYDDGSYTYTYGCDAAGGCTVLLSQVSSCPILYTWDGQEFAYESDLYTGGALGHLTVNGYKKPDPNDGYVVQANAALVDDLLEFRIVEELDEMDYGDEGQLYAVDVPAGIRVVPNGNGSGLLTMAKRLLTIGEVGRPLVSATHVETGEDVTAAVAASDHVYATLSDDPETATWQTIEADLGDLSQATTIKLVVDALARHPLTPQGIANNWAVDPSDWISKLEVLDATGNWVQVPRPLVTLMKPKDFPRAMAIDISHVFLSSTYKIRISWAIKTYVDAVWIDTTPAAPMVITAGTLEAATLDRHGFSYTTPGDPAQYVYAQPGLYSWPLGPGAYTAYGDVTPLLGATDDMFAVFGAGDELALLFAPPAPPAVGLTRYWGLMPVGYYKRRSFDDGSGAVPYSVSPMPFAAMSNFPYAAPEAYPSDATHQAYLTSWNTRVVP
jgi:hypothetical protein